jgi:hypothetical protein
MLSRISFNPAWLVDLPAYKSESARVVRKSADMVFAAWERAGRVPAAWSGFDGLSDEEVEALCDGWKRDAAGYWTHALMRDELTSFMAAHSTRLHELQAEALAMSTEHALLHQETERIKSGVKRVLPKDFCLTSKMRAWMGERGISNEEKQNLIFEEFVTFAAKSSSRYVNWDAAFMNNVLMQLKRDKRAGPSGLSSRSEQVDSRNSDVIAMANRRLLDAQARGSSADLFGGAGR